MSKPVTVRESLLSSVRSPVVAATHGYEPITMTLFPGILSIREAIDSVVLVTYSGVMMQHE